MSRKILLAGGGGFIGGHLAKSLLSRGHDVRVVDVKPLDQWYQRTEGAENIVANLSLATQARLEDRSVLMNC